MGGADSEIEIKKDALLFIVLFWIPPNFEYTPIDPMQIQTLTVTSSLPEPINLYTFHQCIKSDYEFELFSAHHVTKYGKICVNLFSSGKMVLTSCQNKQDAKLIVNDIYLHYSNDCTLK